MFGSGKSKKQHAQGFTLIEVAVALAVFALISTSILKATGDHLAGVRELENITFATYVANNQLTRLQLSKQWPPKNGNKGSEEMAGNTWYWQHKVTKTNDEDLRQIEIVVGLDETYKRTTTSVISYFSKPTSGK